VRVCSLRDLCINSLITQFLVQKLYVNREEKIFANREKKERKNVSTRRCGDPFADSQAFKSPITLKCFS